jgi:tetratricopeptide (TPR) repeat protein
MSDSPTELSFRRGLAALAEARPLEAAEHFLEALQADSRGPRSRPDMRYLSYYGLSLATARQVTPSALQACEIAAENEPSNLVLWLNLGRVYRLMGRTAQAITSFERGLRLDPAHKALRRELALAERRGRPVLPFVPRSNPLNRSLGKLRATLRGNGNSKKKTVPQGLLLSSP